MPMLKFCSSKDGPHAAMLSARGGQVGALNAAARSQGFTLDDLSRRMRAGPRGRRQRGTK